MCLLSIVYSLKNCSQFVPRLRFERRYSDPESEVLFTCRSYVRGLGFEPRYSDPESEVLPLDDPRYLKRRQAIRPSFAKASNSKAISED